MHRDKKLGLALGVLLVGIVAAFFYRNEGPASHAPRLENPQPLDERIAERPHVPYLTGVEADEPRRGDNSRNASHRSLTEDGPTGLAPVPFGQETRGGADVPEPIPAFSESRIPEHNRGWTPIPADRPPRMVPPESSVAGGSSLLHEVRPGETLSGIAHRYLGSSTRYHEIYEANRDQLRSPNDVRAGMSLRIPGRAESTAGANAVPQDRRAEREPARRGAALGRPDLDRGTAGREPSRTPSVPARSISSGTSGSDEIPFGESAGQLLPEEESEPRHIFRPSRNPLARDTAAPRDRADSGRALSQRLPEDLPELEEPGESAGHLLSDPSPRAVPPRKSAAEFLKDAATIDHDPAEETRAAGKGTADLAPGRYIVLRGDTLERIAWRLFGDRGAAARIFEANRDILRSKDDVREGMSLRIPR